MVGTQAYHNCGFSVTLFNEQKDTEAKLRLGEGTLQGLNHLNDVFGRQGAPSACLTSCLGPCSLTAASEQTEV